MDKQFYGGPAYDVPTEQKRSWLTMTGVLPIHQRLAELYVVNKRRKLTPEEMNELQHCLAENVRYCWEMAYMYNISLMASMTNDVDWQHEICADVDQLEAKGRRRKRRNEDNGRNG